MKILMVSMASLHFFRWTEQLKDSGMEVYWFDIRDGGEKVERINWVQQKVGWKNRWNYPGRYLLKKTMPMVYKVIQFFNERSTATEFEKYVLQVKPDVVHSFALQISGMPILPVMRKHNNVKWIYSSWGSDLFYHQNFKDLNKNIIQVIARVDFIITDCKRDYHIALNKGFRGNHLGVFPGGGGYDLIKLKQFNSPFEERKLVLIKGYQNELGNCLTVLDALVDLRKLLLDYEILVFGANISLMKQIKKSELNKWKNFQCLGLVIHDDLLELMGRSLLYIGNSFSDGIPNTLIESIVMGVFPIQSNPGGASAELIQDKKNGLLIENPSDKVEIRNLIEYALKNKGFLKEAITYNTNHLREKYDVSLIKNKLINTYNRTRTFR